MGGAGTRTKGGIEDPDAIVAVVVEEERGKLNMDSGDARRDL
jgi:hypothetical protein